MNHAIFLCAHLLCFTFLFATEPQNHNLVIQPVDFQIESLDETLISHLHQLETDGTFVYVRTENNYFLKLEPDGTLVEIIHMPDIGAKAQLRPGSFAIYEDRLVATNESNQIFWFEQGALTQQITSSHFESIYSFPYYNTNTIGFNGQHTILPLPPGESHLAEVLDLKGKTVTRLGKRPPIDPDFQDGFDSMNAAFWAWSGESWLALFKFRPELRVYNKAFQLEKTIQLNGPAIDEAQARLYDGEPFSRSSRKPIPLFFDFKARGKQAWFMTQGTLHRVDLVKGSVTDRYRFFGKGPDFESASPNRPLAFFMFAPLADGRFILGHPALMWNHDLWVAGPKKKNPVH